MTRDAPGWSFHSFERVVAARGGVVCTSHPLASGAGLEALRSGGNALDAALSAAAVLTVVEPPASHLGGEVFIIAYVASEGRAYALNGSGNAPREIAPDRFADGIPLRGPLSITVPGAVHGWCEASRRWGRLPLEQVLEPAIGYAREGFPIGYKLATELRTNQDLLSSYPYSRQQFLGAGISMGTVLRQPEMARTLEAIASGGAEAFYTGELAREMVRGVREQGGVLSERDLAEHTSAVLEPIRSTYRGLEVLEQPPVSQGHILLQELNIVERFDLAAMGPLSTDALHTLIEAKKLAFADARRHLADPELHDVPLGWLLSKEYARERAALIDLHRARPRVLPGTPPGDSGTDTTYLCAADSEGNVVSWIQSVFHRFGSGVVAGATGVLMNNRLNGFTLEPGHPNCLQPGKKPLHTLNSYLLMRGGRPWLVGGTPGADYQVQTNLQVITNVVDFGMNVAEANDAPWWASHEGNEVVMDSRVPDATIEGLRERGHAIELLEPWRGGRTVQLIQLEEGTMLASSDVRAEGHAAAW